MERAERAAPSQLVAPDCAVSNAARIIMLLRCSRSRRCSSSSAARWLAGAIGMLTPDAPACRNNPDLIYDIMEPYGKDVATFMHVIVLIGAPSLAAAACAAGGEWRSRRGGGPTAMHAAAAQLRSCRS